MRRITTLRAAAVATVAALTVSGCSVYDLPLPGGADTGSEPIEVHAKFRDVLDLVPQSTVKVDDITVGKVSAVALDGYTADVTLELRRDLRLPDNVLAEIRQTSLLGEKFVSLKPPEEGATGRLSNGDTIGLRSTGRNPEVEEVLGAMSLLLNGGGVGQLKIINEELNTALGGREEDVRSLLRQLGSFMGQLDQNKRDIVRAIESLNRLAVQVRRNDDAITSALDELPPALKSINSQRAALVKMLRALQDLSGVGVKVIRASKEATIDSLRNLAPILTKLADAGQDLPRAFQVFLTYPFVDEAVGRDPQVARNLHMGDYTNLSVRLDVNLTEAPTIGPPALPPPVTEVCELTKAQVRAVRRAVAQSIDQAVDQLPLLTRGQRQELKRQLRADYLPSEDDIDCENPQQTVNAIVRRLSDALPRIYRELVRRICRQTPLARVCDRAPDLPLPSLPVPTGGVLGGLGLGRAGTDLDEAPVTPQPLGEIDVLNGPRGDTARLGYNSTLAALLLQGVAER